MQKLTILQRIFTGLILALLVFCQPNELFGQKRTNSNKGHSVNISNHKGKSTIHVTDNGNDYKIE